MTFQNPKISIAICTYNGALFIREQLKSILDQTYQNLEIIIIDDKSSDETVKICKSYNDSRIHIFSNEINLGYTKNFEKAITKCSGEYICLCDQDDIWNLNKVETLLNEIGTNQLIYHDSNFINEHGEVLNVASMANRYHMYQGKDALPFLLFNCISGHASMFRQELTKHLLPFDTRFFHDWWLAYVAVNVGTIKFIDKILVSYRQHTNSITDNLGLKPDIKNTGKRVKINLNWIKKCSDYPNNKNPELIQQAYYTFKMLLSGKKRLSAFLFIVRHYDNLFFIANRKKKSSVSKINFARKLSLANLNEL
ncbi:MULTISPECIES: glycosyltransferase family 2 protein [unclassified Pedobacter]|uniref:glycosyltransferase family 2 protein n=1 Tax=unclassified Pedobacter TaxID=2628915 RepID=UPI001E299C27|nr:MULTISPECIES: glycosyltransferase family 2 protein [unclassified Pedobacter]